MAAMGNTIRHFPDSAAQSAVLVGSGDGWSYFDLGLACSTNSHGEGCDLIEAHKWFNLAALAGSAEAAQCRADLAEDMSARDIAEAQRRARAWMAKHGPGIKP
jgi:hypothetical protein